MYTFYWCCTQLFICRSGACLGSPNDFNFFYFVPLDRFVFQACIWLFLNDTRNNRFDFIDCISYSSSKLKTKKTSKKNMEWHCANSWFTAIFIIIVCFVWANIRLKRWRNFFNTSKCAFPKKLFPKLMIAIAHAARKS